MLFFWAGGEKGALPLETLYATAYSNSKLTLFQHLLVPDNESVGNAQSKNIEPPGISVEELQQEKMQDEKEIQELSLLEAPLMTTKKTLSGDETADVIELTKFAMRAFECEDVESGTLRLKEALAILSLKM